MDVRAWLERCPLVAILRDGQLVYLMQRSAIETSTAPAIAQVMGSSVVQHGWVGARGAYYVRGEIPVLSEPWNLSRTRAFDRLRQEAELADADDAC